MALGVEAGNIHVDHGFTGTNRARPGLGEALASCRRGDTLVVTKLDRLARSLLDAREIKGRLRGKQPELSHHQRKHLLSLVDSGEYTRGEIAELLGVSRTTVYREIQRRSRPGTQ
jgi:DNA invertase Pin-like site-specific DNA recombinase